MSALEAARRIVEMCDKNGHVYESMADEIDDGVTVARAYIKACEALEAIEALSIQAPVKKIARAALSCSAPPEDK